MTALERNTVTKKNIRVAGLTSLALAASLIAMPTAASAEPAPAQGNSLSGKTIFLDPGHQGSDAGNDLNKPVPDGRGGTKPCQTTGATSPDGVAEHKVNWDITQLVKAGLESQGAKVLLSRQDDTGWGGCVDERANAANESKADLAVNIHADSTSESSDPGKGGFHIIVPELPIPDAAVDKAQSGPGRKAAEQMRDAFKTAGFTPANYAGVKDGLQTRADIAAVNLTKVPDVFAELGNLSNPTEAKALSGQDGQLKYAVALVDGVIRYLLAGGAPAASAAPAPTSGAPSVTPHAGTSTPSAPTTKAPTTKAPTTAAPGAKSGTTTPSSQIPTTSVVPGLGLPSLPTTGGNTSATPKPGTSDSEGIDLSSLQSVLPLLSELSETKDPKVIKGLLSSEGSDASSEVLKAMLSVIYEMFGGKLPI